MKNRVEGVSGCSFASERALNSYVRIFLGQTDQNKLSWDNLRRCSDISRRNLAGMPKLGGKSVDKWYPWRYTTAQYAPAALPIALHHSLNSLLSDVSTPERSRQEKGMRDSSSASLLHRLLNSTVDR